MKKTGLQVKYKSDPIAELEITGSDQPWIYCKLIPLGGFEMHKSFLEEIQRDYTAGEVKDWAAFFSSISDEGYVLVGEDYQFIKFIIPFDQLTDLVRVRGQRVQIA